MLSTIVKREFKNTAFSKPNIIATCILVALFILGGLAVRIFAGAPETEADSRVSIAVADSARELTPILEAQGARVSSLTEDPKAVLVTDNTVDAVVTGSAARPEVLANGSAADAVKQVSEASRTYILEKAGLDATAQADLARLDQLKATDVTAEAGEQNALEANPLGAAAGMAIAFLVFMMALTGQGAIATGVVEEKSSRVVEILLTTVRPRTLLLGKVLGIGAASLATMLCYAAGGLAGLALSGKVSDVPAIPGSLTATIAWGLVWILIGFFTVAAISGGVAATVSRTGDLPSINFPLMLLQFVPFYLLIFLGTSAPDAPVLRVLSYVPFFAPYLMGFRGAVGVAGPWEQLIAAAISVVAIVGLAALAGVIYKRSILRTGERVKLISLFRKAA